ncbi:hypothetical protein D3C86_1016570 [compost metagenome]
MGLHPKFANQLLASPLYPALLDEISFWYIFQSTPSAERRSGKVFQFALPLNSESPFHTNAFPFKFSRILAVQK